MGGFITNVTFEGPSVIHFAITTPFGVLRLVKTLLPIAPFTQHVEMRWYAPPLCPTFFVLLMSSIAARALEQDRRVWENKMYRANMMLVSGDVGPSRPSVAGGRASIASRPTSSAAAMSSTGELNWGVRISPLRISGIRIWCALQLRTTIVNAGRGLCSQCAE